MISRNPDKNARRAALFADNQHDGRDESGHPIAGARPIPDYVRKHDAESIEAAADATGARDIVRVTLDPISYSSKPYGREMGAITRRMQAAGAARVTAAEFIEHVREGKTWCAGTFMPNAHGWGSFIGQQLFAVDVDNKARDGRRLHEGDEGFLHPLDALDRCVEHRIPPLALYFTLSAVCTGVDATNAYRYRLVFDAGEPLGKEDAEDVIGRLLALFPEADAACKNVTRLWLGSNGEVWEVAKEWRGAVPWVS